MLSTHGISERRVTGLLWAFLYAQYLTCTQVNSIYLMKYVKQTKDMRGTVKISVMRESSD